MNYELITPHSTFPNPQPLTPNSAVHRRFDSPAANCPRRTGALIAGSQFLCRLTKEPKQLPEGSALFNSRRGCSNSLAPLQINLKLPLRIFSYPLDPQTANATLCCNRIFAQTCRARRPRRAICSHKHYQNPQTLVGATVPDRPHIINVPQAHNHFSFFIVHFSFGGTPLTPNP